MIAVWVLLIVNMFMINAEVEKKKKKKVKR